MTTKMTAKKARIRERPKTKSLKSLHSAVGKPWNSSPREGSSSRERRVWMEDGAILKVRLV